MNSGRGAVGIWPRLLIEGMPIYEKEEILADRLEVFLFTGGQI